MSKKKAELALGDDGADMLRYGIATRITQPALPVAHKDPWKHGQDPRQFVAFEDAGPEAIGELPYGF